MKIIVAGTGGQGAITAARLLAEFFAGRGHEVVSAQLHGMAQRGGSVQASVLIDTGPCPALPLGGADIVLGLEPAETARMLPYISGRTVVIMNTAPVVPYILSQQAVRGEGDGKYPDVEELKAAIGSVARGFYSFDATETAAGAGSVRSLNTVMLGALFGAGLLPAAPGEFIDAVPKNLPPKLVEANNKAFLAGVALGKEFEKSED